MKTLVLAISAAVLFSLTGAVAVAPTASAQPTQISVAPLLPETGAAVSEPTPSTSIQTPIHDSESQPSQPQVQPQVQSDSTSTHPTRLRIPSISLNNPIVPVGLTPEGNMDVPSGTTNNVGWYQNGPVPGQIGSAVLDAHVYAAFSDLNKMKVGDTLDVVLSDGETKRFVVQEMTLYALADVPTQRLFNAGGDEYLNLITCAGKLTPDRSTYTHRLVVYATLVQ